MLARHQSLKELEAEIERCLVCIREAGSHIDNSVLITRLVSVLGELPAWPAGQFNTKLYKNRHFQQFIQKHMARINPLVHSWLFVVSASMSKNTYYQIKSNLKTICCSEKRYLLAEKNNFTQPCFVRIVYASECESLIKLYQRYLPKPRLGLFLGYSLPAEFVERYRQDDAVINEMTMAVSDQQLERASIVTQRAYRAKMRRVDETKRLMDAYRLSHEKAVELITQANRPYRPLCDGSAELSARIMRAAWKVKCFTTVSHYTDLAHLRSICDDGLYGRRSLRKGIFAFEPAALENVDLKNGDYDSICFGPHYVDPSAVAKGIQLTFKADKIAAKNPAVFVKQRDFGMPLDVIRTIRLKNRDLHFSYSHVHDDHNDVLTTSFLLLDSHADGGSCLTDARNPQAKVMASSTDKNVSLMTSNRKQMHAILTLNFFRFIDHLRNKKSKKPSDLIRGIYADMNSLSDDELQAFMNELALKMTDYMEFNITGCHLIDFDSVVSIAHLQSDLFNAAQYDPVPALKITFAELIEEIAEGKMKILMLLKKEFPPLFESERFLSYLIGKTHQPDVLKVLQEARERTPLVVWRQQLSLTHQSAVSPRK